MRISIITPIYYGKRYIKDIQSMIERNMQYLYGNHEIEFVIVNDSPEEPILSEDISPADAYDIVRVEYPENIGIQGARIEGVKKASGDFVLMLDQDDRIADNYLQSQITHIKKKTAVVVANGISQLKDGKKLLYRYAPMQWTVKNIWFYAKFDCRIISPGQCLIKKNEIPQLWLENPLRYNGADDYLLWLLLLSQGSRFTINRDVIYTHVLNGANASADLEMMRKSVEEAMTVAEPCVKNRYIQIINERVQKNNKSLFVKLVESMNRE